MIRVLTLSLALLPPGCFPYYGAPHGQVDTAPGDTTASGELTSAHTGWKDPACWACHSEDEHNSGMEPWGCVPCHGTNGAPAGHTDSTPCSGCHSQPHGADGFPDPDSCLACHP